METRVEKGITAAGKTVTYRRARKEEAEDILDFINYVFSHDHRPHDFRYDNNPGMYNSDYPFWEDHYVAIEDDRHIRATLSVTKFEKTVGGITLTFGHVGQVSVHPYHRGEGHMRALMHMAIQDMRDAGYYDFSNLGGLRQRYQYYGYMPAFYRTIYTVTSTNLRHLLAGREPRVSICKNQVLLGDALLGSIEGDLVSLSDWSYLPDAIAVLFSQMNCSSYEFIPFPGEAEAAAALDDICETVRVEHTCQVLIFHFEKVMKAALQPRAAAGELETGEVTISVGNEAFGLRVKDGTVETWKCTSPSMCFEPLELQRLLLSFSANRAEKKLPLSWCPISM